MLEDFRFYDSGLFELIDRLVLPRIEVLKIHTEVLGRAPDERDILAMQTARSPAILRERLLALATTNRP